MFVRRSPLFKILPAIVLLSASGAFILFYYSKNYRQNISSPVEKEAADQVKGASVSANPFGKLSSSDSPGAKSDVKDKASAQVTVSEGNANGSQTGSSNSVSSADSSDEPDTSSGASPVPTDDSPESSVLTDSQLAVEDVTNVVLNDMKSGNFAALYNLMSEEWKETFSVSREDFVNTLSQSASIKEVSITSAPNIYGANNEWAEQSVRFALPDGSAQNYSNLYHWEGTGANSAWTLFGTRDE